MDKEKLIQRYFEGSLSEEEQRVLFALLETDKKFKEQFEYEKDLRAPITDQHRKANKEKLREFEGAAPGIKKNQVYWKKTWALVASAALLIALGWLILLNRTGTTDQLFATYYEKYPDTEYLITRGGSEDNSLKRKAIAAYESEDFDEAIQLFSELRTENESDASFFLAQAYIGNEDWDEAEDQLLPLSEGPSEFASEALWYLALIHLRQDDEQQAAVSLKKLLRRGDYKKNEAGDLLAQLAYSPEE